MATSNGVSKYFYPVDSCCMAIFMPILTLLLKKLKHIHIYTRTQQQKHSVSYSHYSPNDKYECVRRTTEQDFDKKKPTHTHIHPQTPKQQRQEIK